MTTYYSNELAGDATGLTTAPSASLRPAATVYAARRKRFRSTITYAQQAAGSVFVLADVPSGHTFEFGLLNADTSSGSTTLAIGTSADSAKYKAAAAFTATDTPTIFGKVAPVAASPFSTTERVIMTTAAATAPTSGTLVVDLFFSAAN